MFIFTKNLILKAENIESIGFVWLGKCMSSSLPDSLKDIALAKVYYNQTSEVFSGSNNDALKIFNEIKQAIKNNDQVYEIDYKNLENEEF